jgi:hypothetical protein
VTPPESHLGGEIKLHKKLIPKLFDFVYYQKEHLKHKADPHHDHILPALVPVHLMSSVFLAHLSSRPNAET